MTHPTKLAPPTGAGPEEGWGLRFFIHALVFLTFLPLWTWKLLEPHPVPEHLKAGLDRAGLSFVAAKSLHASGYAFLTVLAGTLPVPRRWRIFLVGLLVLHGVATEIGQTFVPNRTGRVYDVLIDWTGIAAGVLVVRWWVGTSRPRSLAN
ncbi:MAG: VanZ family protein [Gemmataceae bacterium]|nr:VanZ family protein [Gemmataceae bacterium]